MIYLYDTFESIKEPKSCEQARCYCCFEGEDVRIPRALLDSPQALALVHLLVEGYNAADSEEKAAYWREATESVVQWMIEKGIVETVSS